MLETDGVDAVHDYFEPARLSQWHQTCADAELDEWRERCVPVPGPPPAASLFQLVRHTSVIRFTHSENFCD